MTRNNMFAHTAVIMAMVVLGSGVACAAGAEGVLETERRPNVLMIAVDDLNDWIGVLGGHPQAHTPNFDRLAASGVLFTNAHCPGTACNPSRSAILTGVSPATSGLYDNGQKMREVLPTAELLPKYFSRHGYHAAGSGKILHYFIDAGSWDDYFPEAASENPFPRTLYPENRPVSLPRGWPWQYVETDWGPLDATDEEFGGDWLVSEWVGEQLSRDHDQPFFLACGLYRPHAAPTATSPTSASRASGSGAFRDIWRRSRLPTRCSGGCSMRSKRGLTLRTRSSCSGATTAGIWARSSTGRSIHHGVLSPACR